MVIHKRSMMFPWILISTLLLFVSFVTASGSEMNTNYITFSTKKFITLCTFNHFLVHLHFHPYIQLHFHPFFYFYIHFFLSPISLISLLTFYFVHTHIFFLSFFQHYFHSLFHIHPTTHPFILCFLQSHQQIYQSNILLKYVAFPFYLHIKEKFHTFFIIFQCISL